MDTLMTYMAFMGKYYKMQNMKICLRDTLVCAITVAGIKIEANGTPNASAKLVLATVSLVGN